MNRSIPVLFFFVIVLSGAAFATEKTDPPKTVAEPVPPPQDGEPAATVILPPVAPAHAPAPIATQKAEPVKPAPGAPASPAVAAQPGEDEDKIGDKPEAVAANATKPLMEEMAPTDALNARGRKTYEVLGEIKVAMELISKDLDNNGKEITRLIKTSDTLAKKITTLADLYNDDENFRDHCATAKRDTLRLNDELSQVPRKWAHVRWAFNDTLTDTRKIRIMGRDLAEAEPRTTRVVGKDGKVTNTEPLPVVNPAIAKREQNRANADAMRAMQKKQEELMKAPAIKTGNDD